MSALTSSSAEDQLESLLKPYRDRSNAHIQAIWEEFAAEHPVSTFPSSRTMRDNSRLFRAGKRYRYALALAGYQLLTGEAPSRGLERAATWLEWYHLYTLFLDDIMDEDVRRRTLASAWATDAKLFRGPGADRPALVFRTQRHRYGVSQAILDALRIRSLAERAIEGATDLDASVRLAPNARASFLRAYGRGPRTTKNDIRSVRNLFRENVLPTMEARIADHLVEARRALDRLPPKDPGARKLLETLLEAQRTRVR